MIDCTIHVDVENDGTVFDHAGVPAQIDLDATGQFAYITAEVDLGILGQSITIGIAADTLRQVIA